jgi:hypothetical protein
MTTNARVMWTARCKSGYEFNGKACQHVTRRGALLCDSCLDAVVIPSVRHTGMLTRAIGAVVALFTA